MKVVIKVVLYMEVLIMKLQHKKEHLLLQLEKVLKVVKVKEFLMLIVYKCQKFKVDKEFL